MNCKPNDMAVVVGEEPDCLCNIGATLRVLRSVSGPGLAPMWLFAEESRPLKLTAGGNVKWSDEIDGYIADRFLVPFRNAGDPHAGAVPAPGEAVGA